MKLKQSKLDSEMEKQPKLDSNINVEQSELDSKINLEEQPELDRSVLESYIIENVAKCQAVRREIVAELQKKVKLLRKEMKDEGKQEDLQATEADKLSGIATFLKKSVIFKLMTLALLNRKSLKKKSNGEDALQKERAVHIFASHNSVKPIILNFRNKYTKWRTANDLLKTMTKRTKSAKIAGDKKNGIAKNKKKQGKKSLKRKNSEMYAGGNNNYENYPLPKKQRNMKQESSVLNGLSNKKTWFDSGNSQNEVTEDAQGSERPENQNYRQNGRGGRFNHGGKFNGRGGNTQYGNKGPGNWGGGNGFGRNRSQPWQIKFEGGANSISVPDACQNKSTSTETQEASKPSLLRPDWLINPQEYKPTPSFYGRGGNFRGRSEPSFQNNNNVTPDWKSKNAAAPSWLKSPQQDNLFNNSMSKITKFD